LRVGRRSILKAKPLITVTINGAEGSHFVALLCLWQCC